MKVDNFGFPVTICLQITALLLLVNERIFETIYRVTVRSILQELIRRWDSERELFNDDIAHT